jgi:hypothetical protein
MIEGVDDGSAVRELLFTFPRLVESEHDRIAGERLAQVGTIKVEYQFARFKEQKMVTGMNLQVTDSSGFSQANKKDAKHAPTNATSRMGKATSARSSGHRHRGGPQMHDIWAEEGPKRTVTLLYRMRHDLQRMGFLQDVTGTSMPTRTPLSLGVP